jgi:hypothetical protein
MGLLGAVHVSTTENEKRYLGHTHKVTRSTVTTESEAEWYRSDSNSH